MRFHDFLADSWEIFDKSGVYGEFMAMLFSVGLWNGSLGNATESVQSYNQLNLMLRYTT